MPKNIQGDEEQNAIYSKPLFNSRSTSRSWRTSPKLSRKDPSVPSEILSKRFPDIQTDLIQMDLQYYDLDYKKLTSGGLELIIFFDIYDVPTPNWMLLALNFYVQAGVAQLVRILSGNQALPGNRPEQVLSDNFVSAREKHHFYYKKDLAGKYFYNSELSMDVFKDLTSVNDIRLQAKTAVDSYSQMMGYQFYSRSFPTYSGSLLSIMIKYLIDTYLVSGAGSELSYSIDYKYLASKMNVQNLPLISSENIYSEEPLPELIGTQDFANVPGFKAVQFENLFINIPLNSNVHFQSTTLLHQEFYPYRTSFVILDCHIYNYKEYGVPLMPYYAILFETFGFTQYLPAEDSERKPLPVEIPDNILENIFRAVKTNNFYYGLNAVAQSGFVKFSDLSEDDPLYLFLMGNLNMGQFLTSSLDQGAQETGSMLAGMWDSLVDPSINAYQLFDGGIASWYPVTGIVTSKQKKEITPYIRQKDLGYALLFRENNRIYIWKFTTLDFLIANFFSPRNDLKEFIAWNYADFTFPKGEILTYKDKWFK